MIMETVGKILTELHALIRRKGLLRERCDRTIEMFSEAGEAQQVEQVSCKYQVGGSNPPIGSQEREE